MRGLKLLLAVVMIIDLSEADENIKLHTNDERCNATGVCHDMNYGDKNVRVTFFESNYGGGLTNEYSTLTFVNSKFANFPSQLFTAFKIQKLDFTNCYLVNLRSDDFLGAESLSVLLMSGNLITEITPRLFNNAQSLTSLFLDASRISILHDDSFYGLERLKILDLSQNLIETLPSKIFYNLPSIQQINLAENRIKVIEEVLFANNPKLFIIDLHRNSLNEIQEYAFRHKILQDLDISHNPDLKVLACANMKVEYLWAKHCSLNRINIYGEVDHADLKNNFIKEIYFSKPEFLKSLNLKDNSLEQVSLLDLAVNLRDLDVSHNPHLTAFPDDWQINSLEKLDLSNTSLKQIPQAVFNSADKLRFLNVSFNQLKEVNTSNFKHLKKLSEFYIHHNNWECINLLELMNVVIRPSAISYTLDKFDENFPGKYIYGIKCMYLSMTDENYRLYELTSHQLDNLPKTFSVQEFNELKFEHMKEVEKLRSEFKDFVRNNDRKFDSVLDILNKIEMHLNTL